MISNCGFNEREFNQICENEWREGNTISKVHCGVGTYRNIMSWGNMYKRFTHDFDLKIKNVVSIYDSDFGTIEILLDRNLADNEMQVFSNV